MVLEGTIHSAMTSTQLWKNYIFRKLLLTPINMSRHNSCDNLCSEQRIEKVFVLLSEPVIERRWHSNWRRRHHPDNITKNWKWKGTNIYSSSSDLLGKTEIKKRDHRLDYTTFFAWLPQALKTSVFYRLPIFHQFSLITVWRLWNNWSLDTCLILKQR